MNGGPLPSGHTHLLGRERGRQRGGGGGVLGLVRDKYCAVRRETQKETKKEEEG